MPVSRVPQYITVCHQQMKETKSCLMAYKEVIITTHSCLGSTKDITKTALLTLCHLHQYIEWVLQLKPLSTIVKKRQENTPHGGFTEIEKKDFC